MGKKQVAFKVLAEDCSNGISTRAKRFFTEVREIVQLAETGAVIPIYYFDFIVVNQYRFPYMIMKFYPFTLKKWITDNPVNSLSDLLPILNQLLSCVSVIHNHNIVHRDLKPDNIMVSEDGQIALGDFGIAWFDPEHYERLTKTSTGERLANYAFSPPEQFHKKLIIKPSNDIYSIGQIVQWLVTGDTLRGTGRTFLSTKDHSFGIIDSIINGMLQQQAENRPQSIEEVRKLIDESLRPRKSSGYDNVLFNLRKFNEILRASFPGAKGLFKITKKEDIDRLLSQLSKNLSELNLWWTQGYSNSQIPEIKQLEDGTWLIEGEECDIEEIWVNKYPSYDREYILIKTRPMKPFGIYSNEPDDEYEEAGLFNGTYITRSEYDDGYAMINGNSVRLDQTTELRARHLIPEYKFIVTEYHSLSLMENDPVVNAVYQNMKKQGTITREELQPLSRTRIHPDSARFK